VTGIQQTLTIIDLKPKMTTKRLTHIYPNQASMSANVHTHSYFSE